jgi:hypothetical protein
MTWRDHIKVHPAAELFPMMSDEELRVLARDIKKQGLQNDVVLWFPDKVSFKPKIQDLFLLDGRNRLEALSRSGATEAQIAKHLDNAILHDVTTNPWQFVVSANIVRRHLNADQKRALIATLLKATPKKSDRQIAKMVKGSPTTVGTVRAKLEEAGDVSKLDTRTDTLGREQPAKPKPASGQKRAIAIIGFSMLLRHKTGETLDDLTRLLRDAQRPIAVIPLPRRVALARGYLAALGVSVDDLRPI